MKGMKLVVEDRNLEMRTIPLDGVNVFWLEGYGWDITMGEDTEGNPYVSVAIAQGKKHELMVTEPSFKGRILKIHLRSIQRQVGC